MSRTARMLSSGLKHHQSGALSAAEKLYRKILRAQPQHTDALHLLGVIANRMCKSELAVQLIGRAIEINPTVSMYHNSLGNALLAAGEQELAKTSYLSAINADPDFADAEYNLGNLHRLQKDYVAAAKRYRRAIELSPSQADVHNNMGATLAEMGSIDEAIEAFSRALELNPAYAEAHFNQGSEFAKRGEHSRAVKQLRRAIELRPDYAKAFHNLGASQQALGDLAAATASYRRALEYRPDDKEIVSNLAAALVLQGDVEGIRYFDQIVAEHPDDAQVHWNLSIALLLLGDYTRGWREYEWRWKWDKFPSPKRNFEQPQWHGEPLDGASILLHAEQGFGDTLQFVRYALLVAQRGGRVILEVQPGLHRLLEHVPGVVECVRQGDPLPEFRWHCPLMSLPLAFGTTRLTIPVMSSPVYGEGSMNTFADSHETERLKVGLVWAGNPKHQLDQLRSMSLKHFLPLTEVESVSFVSLQKEPAAGQINEGHLPFVLPDALADVRDFFDTAAVIAKLDLVITVDTAVAHLAGAMGKPVWLLLANVPDWRWGLGLETTPWYPTARLFRQSFAGGWADVMEKVAGELTLFVEAKREHDHLERSQWGSLRCAANAGTFA